ncbi:Abscisic acid G-protein coupled receptor-domain-containing protein [Suillus subalutaceus]|uniref:Abscisic acid G-protein coupled receptor-domain-containing protein n=1 Tax=Suillus subalutaceus TaxID=48586 RepID=UPI001B87BF99|nr:Abscisic acid G-protein coupled receptor-domain-containing protein [Suillus subalutaceus]KAG1838540.1 Abscisic acid G-protein coupled receptor-domain-containing protein [Suillus subalutaceus]
MLMCQGLDWLEPRIRLLSWRISLFLLLFTILLLVPISFSLILTYRPDTPGFVQSRALPIRIAFALAPVALFVFGLSYIPLPAELLLDSPLSAVTARLVTLGTTVLGLLSGLGAVSGAWGVINWSRSMPTASSIASAENALERVKSDLRDRSRDLDDYVSSKPQPDGSWLSRMSFKRNGQQGSIQQEVIGLQALEEQMNLRVVALKRNRVAAEYAESFTGKTITWSWAVYCVCRVCSSAFNIISPTVSNSGHSSASYGDIVAHILAWLFSLLPFSATGDEGRPQFDTPSLSKQISLSLVGVIILCSLRLVLRGVTRAFHVTSRKTSASLMILTLAQLMGIYLLSTLVQLRTTFPPAVSPVIDESQEPQGLSDDSMNLFATLPEYSLFGGLFDWSFLIGAAGCAFARWARSSFEGEDLDV